MNQISFGANYIKPAVINRKSNKGYCPQVVAFVELDPSNKKDKGAVKRLNNLWGETLASFIDLFYGLGKEHVYVVTKQKKDFRNINSDEILGIAEFIENNSYFCITFAAIHFHNIQQKCSLFLTVTDFIDSLRAGSNPRSCHICKSARQNDKTGTPVHICFHQIHKSKKSLEKKGKRG